MLNALNQVHGALLPETSPTDSRTETSFSRPAAIEVVLHPWAAGNRQLHYPLPPGDPRRRTLR